MKAKVGDWVRYYRDGCLTIGVVLYTRTTISGGVEYLTDCGVMTEDSVLEVRSHPEGGAGPLPAYPEGGRMSNPIPAALREAQGSMNWGLCPQCGETYERLACGPSHATRRAVVVEQYGRRCMAAALRWALGPGYEDEAGPSFREVIAALEQESEATP